jgi:hypothetical protein
MQNLTVRGIYCSRTQTETTTVYEPKKILSVEEHIQKEQDLRDHYVKKFVQECEKNLFLLGLLRGTDLQLRGVHYYPLYGYVGSIELWQAGGMDVVKQTLLNYLDLYPPEEAELATDSCQWIQVEGYEDPKKKNPDSVSTKLIAPVWVSVENTVKASGTRVSFHWFTMLQEVIEDDENGTYADGDEVIVRMDLNIVQARNWASIACTTGHSPGASDITVGSQTTRHKFRGVRTWKHGRGSSAQTWNYTFYWDRGVTIEDILDTQEKFTEIRDR